jgi:endoglucanase
MKTFNKTKIKVAALLIMLLLFGKANAQFVTTQGTQIIDKNGNPIVFAGMNLGNWLVWEGYLMMGDFNYRTHTQFFNSVKSAFGGNLTQAIDFEHQWRMNYVTEQAIIDLKNMGYNSVRVPFHHNMFWNGTTVVDNGFQYFDRVITFCRNNGMYVLLDMHAAPGYQNPGDHCDNLESNSSQPRTSVHFWDGNNISIASQVWKHIATHYANEPVIWGYDLINEPVPQPGREFELLTSMITMRNAIRQVDNNHIIVAEGNWWASDMQKLDWLDAQTQSATGVTAKWDSKLVYETHHYASDPSALTGRLAITNKLNIPLILGEYGENSDNVIRQFTDWCIANKVGYFPWSFKKMIHDKCLWTVPSNANYDAVRNYINSGGTPPANAYNNLISFCNNNIANGKPGITFWQGFYDATKPPAPPVRFAIPGTIQAEGYSAQSGVGLETCSDTGGGQNIAQLAAGDWAEYNVNVQTAGTYQVQFRVASAAATGQLQLVNGSTVLATVTIPNTTGWQTWATVTANVTLPAGQYALRLNFTGPDFNMNWFSFVSGGPTIPAAPTNLTAAAGNAQVSLTWVASTGATSYTVKRSTTSGGSYSDVATGVTSTSYTNTGLTNGTTYYYVVTAVNSAGASGNSNQASATPQAPVTVPAAPTNLTATAGNAQISLTWTASAGATSYTVKRSTTSGSSYSDVATGVISTSYTNTGLTNGTTYYYVVTAVNTAGASGNSNQASATPQAMVTIPSAPTNLAATAGNAQVALTWIASSGATSYTVKRSTTSGGSYSDVATGVTTVNYTNTGLTNGTTYYYVVTAVNTAGASGNSNQASATPSGSSINAFATMEAESFTSMSGIQTESCSEGGLDVGWTDSNDFLAFNNVNFGTGAVSVDARIASGASFTGTAQLRIGSTTGTLIGTISFGGTGGWQTWVTRNATVTGVSGVQNLFVVFQGGSGIGNVNWIKFNATNNINAFNQIDAESYSSMSGIQTEACSEGGLDVGWTDTNDFLAFNNLDFGTGALSADVRIASGATFTGTAQLRIGSTTGTLIGTLSFGSTGGWQTWVTRNIPITGATGVKNLFMVFQGGGGIGNVNWIKFKTTSSREATSVINDNDNLSLAAELYPNPGNGKKIGLKLRGGAYQAATSVTIINMQGVVVYEKTIMDTEEDLHLNNELKAGMYFIQIKKGNEKVMKRFVVN